jgi:SMC domain protein
VFRNVLWALKTNNRSNWDWFQDTLQSVFPDLVVDAEFNAETGENIVGTITRGSLKLPIDASGTGVLQMVQILAYIGLYEPRVLILDEPDSHLHPNNQRKLVSLLEKATQDKGFQVLISTHSRPFIDKLSSVGAKFVWVADGAVKSDNFDMIQAFSNLGALDVADYLDGGSTKKLILTEDTDVEYIRTIAVASGVSEDSTVIRSYNGVGNLNSAIELARFIKEQYRGTQVYIHRDRDRLNDKQVEEIKRKISGSGAVPFVTSGTDCEAYFVNPEHVSYVFPQISQNEAEDLVEEAIDLARSTSEAKLADDIFYDKMRIYNESGGKVERPKPSKITEEAKRLYGDNPARYMYGKKALGYLKNLIQERLTINNANGLVCPSKYVAVSEFRANPDSLHEG